jgi:hypothetical protein
MFELEEPKGKPQSDPDALPDCPKCRNTRHLPVDEYTDRPCTCTYLAVARARIPAVILEPVIDWPHPNPLCQYNDDKTRIMGTQAHQDLHLVGPWETLRPYLACALYFQVNTKPAWSCAVTTDNAILRASVGNGELYPGDGKRERVQMSDIVTPPSLLIVRLGYIPGPNKAAPSSLLEAIKSREALGKPTWVIEDPSEPFKTGYAAWSSEVSKYIERRFRRGELS